MATAPRYNQNGEKVGDVTLDPRLFDVAPNATLLHQVVMVQQGNARAPIAHTKTRGEVRGGGKKPWKQKGTGRARHGSIRSPIWKGGGVTFGPRNARSFQRALPVKAKRKALAMALTDKARHNAVAILESLSLAEPKTKVVATLLRKLGVPTPTLLVMGDRNVAFIRSVRNLPRATTIAAHSLNVVDVIKHGSIVAVDGALDVVAKTFLARAKG